MFGSIFHNVDSTDRTGITKNVSTMYLLSILILVFTLFHIFICVTSQQTLQPVFKTVEHKACLPIYLAHNNGLAHFNNKRNGEHNY